MSNCEFEQELVNLRTRSGAVGLDALVRIACDTAAPAAASVSAARALMEHAGLLGTAKDVEKVREEAKRGERRNVIDYTDVLRSLANLPQSRPRGPSAVEAVGAEAC